MLFRNFENQPGFRHLVHNRASGIRSLKPEWHQITEAREVVQSANQHSPQRKPLLRGFEGVLHFMGREVKGR